MPRRMVRQRSKGSKLPAGCVVVSRPSRWGNPLRGDNAALWFKVWMQNPSKTGAQIVEVAAVARDVLICEVKWMQRSGRDYLAGVSALRERDLACWCALDKPCHADVLLELANE